VDAFDLETGELVYTAAVHDRPVHCVALVSTASEQIPVFVTCCHGGTIKLVELQTGKILMRVRSVVSTPCYGVCICEGKRPLIIAGCFNKIEIWGIPLGRSQGSLTGHRGRVMCVLCHRSHPAYIDAELPGFIASGDDRGFIRTWLLEEPWTPLLEIEAHDASILSITLKRPMENSDIDRYRLLTTSEDKTFRIFDCMTGECLGRVSNHNGPVPALSILSLNGPIKSHKSTETSALTKETVPRWQEDVVITCGLDKRINFWRLSDLTLLHCMERTKPVRGVASCIVPRPFMIATSMDEGLEIIDLTIYDDLPSELKHLIRYHEPEVVRRTRAEQTG
jgi:WD40 repeat protein